MLKAQASNDVALYQKKEQEITNLTAQYESERQHIRAQQAQAIPLLFGNMLSETGLHPLDLKIITKALNCF